MGWIVDLIIDYFWVSFVVHYSKDRPWWVFLLLALSPLIALALVIGVLLLIFQI